MGPSHNLSGCHRRSCLSPLYMSMYIHISFLNLLFKVISMLYMQKTLTSLWIILVILTDLRYLWKKIKRPPKAFKAHPNELNSVIQMSDRRINKRSAILILIHLKKLEHLKYVKVCSHSAEKKLTSNCLQKPTEYKCL